AAQPETAPPPAPSIATVTAATAAGTERLRVLLVDDDPGLRMLLRTTFEIIDIEVEEADAVPAAEKIVAARPPDAVVLDVALPGSDGLSFCRRLKADPKTSHIPVVLLTGADEATEATAR